MERDNSRPTQTSDGESPNDKQSKDATPLSLDNPRSEYFASGHEATDDLLGECPDTQELGYCFTGGSDFVGYIESVNGTGSAECWEFQATRYEMLVIAKHWYRKFCDIDLFRFQYQPTDNTDWRTEKYADRRLCRIRRLLGDGPLDRIVSEVDAELRELLGESEWKQFKAQRQHDSRV